MLIWFGSVINTESVNIHPFVSVMIKTCIPALKARGSLVPQSSLYGLTPPDIFSIAVPSFTLLHNALVVT